jgi:hypothetical protein
LTIAIIPAVATVVAAAFAFFPNSCSAPSTGESATDDQPAAQEGGISFRIDPDLAEYRGGWEVAFDGPLPDTDDYPPGRPNYEQVYSWATARGAVDVGESHLRLLLENKGPDRVTIRSVNAKVVTRSAPIAVTDVISPSAGTNDLVALGFDLDSGDLVAAQPEKLGEGRNTDTSDMPFFSTKNVTLDPGESSDIKITTRTTECHCLYKFEVVLVKPDSTTTMEIGDMNGRPLEITGRAQSYDNTYENGQLGCMKYSLFATADRVIDCDRPA